MTDQLDLVVPAHPKDIDTVTAAIDGAAAYVMGIRRIYVVSSHEYKPRSPAELWIPESTASALPSAEAIKARWLSENPELAHRSGWIHQQLLKLGAASYIDDLLPDFLCIDADTIFLRPTQFLYDGFKFTYTSSHYQAHSPYLAAYRCLLGDEPGRVSFTAHHMHYNVDLLSMLFSQIETRHNTPWSAAYLACVDYGESSPINEQDIYGTWVTTHHPSVAYHRPLRWADSQTVPDAEQRMRLAEQVDFVSTHTYLRRESLLRVADRARLRKAAAAAAKRIPGGLSGARWVNAHVARRRWKRSGSRGAPPPAVKEDIVRRYGRQWKLKDFVETGTFRGDMVAAVCDQFRSVISIEGDPHLHRFATVRHADRANVTLLEGDNVELLPQVVSSLKDRTLFWLNAHYYPGGLAARRDVGASVKKELQIILSQNLPPHVVLVDDAHEFEGTRDHTALQDVEATVASLRPGWVVDVKDDVIRIHPPSLTLTLIEVVVHKREVRS